MDTFTLKLNKQQIETIGAALEQMPFRAVNALIADINRQLQEQMKQAGESNDA